MTSTARPWSSRLSVGGIAAVLALVALVGLPFMADDFWLRLASRVLIFGLAAVSLDLLIGYAGLVSFGHAAFMGVGAYVAGVLTNAGWDGALVVWPASALAAGLLALVIGALSLRSSGLYFIMITLAFAQMVYYVLQSLRVLGGDDGFATTRNTFGTLLDPYDSASFYYVVLLVCVAVTGLIAVVVRSEFGAVLRGSRDNDLRLHALGVSTLPHRLGIFTASGIVAGLSGAMLANLTGYIAPTFASWQVSGELLVMVLLGGAGTLVGGLVGAAVLIGLSELLSDLTEHWGLYLGALILLRALYVREGLLALLLRGRRHE